MNDIIELLTMSEEEAYEHVIRFLQDQNIKFEEHPDYIVTRMHTKPCPLICVHLDTVSKVPPMPKDILKRGRLITLKESSKATCLGADDRAGLWIVIDMFIHGTQTDFEYGFFMGEEQFGIGSSAYALTDPDHTCYIGLDRGGYELNVALYGYDNDKLTKYFEEEGYEAQHGSFSDCLVLAESTGKACLNVSVGYTRQHSKSEALDCVQMIHTSNIMKEIIIPEEDYEAKTIIQDDLTVGSPLCCDICGEHRPLYIRFEGQQLVCEECRDEN